MDLKIVMLLFFVLAAVISTSSAGKHKKVVIHVPLKVKKIKHTHTVYKTIHHQDHGHHHDHGHHDHGHHSRGDNLEEHEHFHHFGDHTIKHPKFALPHGR